MKKVTKLIAGVVLAASVAATAGMFAGCGKDNEEPQPQPQPQPQGTTYTGAYAYSNTWGTYGVKVDVTVNDGKITSVKYADAQPDGWTNVTASWDTDGSKAAGVADYLKKFEGKTVDEVLALDVAVTATGQPDSDNGDASQGDLIYTGATQTSGRIILAVQDALKDNFYCGTATTNYHSKDITINTVVAVKDGKISELYVSDDSVIATGDNWITKFNAGVAAMNTSLIGKTVAEVLALETTYTPAENTLGTVATGATVSSNLYVASIKDALSGLAE